MSAATLGLCKGLGMRACTTCARNVDNNDGIVAARTIRPAADPPRCADWRPLAVAERYPRGAFA